MPGFTLGQHGTSMSIGDDIPITWDSARTWTYLTSPPQRASTTSLTFPRITEGLLARGYSARDLEKG